jgi:hypothetical protein
MPTVPIITPIRIPREEPIRDRRRQEVGILENALVHRHLVTPLRDNDLRRDD